MLVDLHTHSAVSDGTQAPGEVVAAAARAGLDVVALTDHDSTAGWTEAAAQARRLGIALVPGMEVSCSAGGVSVHLLSYLHDPDDAELAATVTAARESREHRAQRMVELLSADVDISWPFVLEHVGGAATIGRPHIADALVARGVVGDRAEAFAGLLSSSSPYYLVHYAPDPVDAVRLVLAAGGVPVMAHPRARSRGRIVGDDVIEAMVDAGLAGLEVGHRDNPAEDQEQLRDLARRWDLLVTGSSDYHGAGKPNRLGENTTPPEVLEQIVSSATGSSLVG